MAPVIWFALAAVFCGFVAAFLWAARKRGDARQAGAGTAPRHGERQEGSTLEGVPVYFVADTDDGRRAADQDWNAPGGDSGDSGDGGGGDGGD